MKPNMQRYRSGHNGADSKSVCRQLHEGSNPSRCAKSSQAIYSLRRLFSKSHRALIPLLILSKSQPLCWGVIWFRALTWEPLRLKCSFSPSRSKLYLACSGFFIYKQKGSDCTESFQPTKKIRRSRRIFFGVHCDQKSFQKLLRIAALRLGTALK